MLRITTCVDPARTRLVVEGRLTGASVGELERCWQATVSRESPESIIIDLNSVSFIDMCGKQLLARMHEQGVSFAASGLLVKSLIDEIDELGH